MKTSEDLRRLLISIDHRGYPAYKDTRGRWSYGNYILSIDHVQGDPFASPSNVSVIVPGRTALFPKEYMTPKYRLVTLEDMLLRSFSVNATAGATAPNGAAAIGGTKVPSGATVPAKADSSLSPVPDRKSWNGQHAAWIRQAVT